MLKKTNFKFIPLGILIGVLLPVALITGSCQVSGKIHHGKDGFVQIFDGKTLNGWEGDPKYWRVENGNLVGEITPATLLKTNSFLIWRGGRPSDFELNLEFKITKNGNSGINYRSVELSDVPYALKGYQADIDGANRYTGQNYEERVRTTLAYRGQKVIVKPFDNTAQPVSLKEHIKNNAWTETTVIGSLGDPEVLKSKINFEDWNTYRLVIKGNHLQHYVNGTLMSDVTDNDTVNGKSEGWMGVQVHVGPPMKVEYRNIMLKQ
ncbi:MAG: DUF1080 domain-containing protein [Sediminibacterium sp.]